MNTSVGRISILLLIFLLLAVSACTSFNDHEEQILPDGTYEVYLVDLDLTSSLLTVDEMEFVSIFETERIAELGLDPQADFPSGFYLYNETEAYVVMPLEADPHIEVMLWGEEPGAAWLTPAELKERMAEYTAPYSILVQNGEVIEIFEMYVP